MNLKKETKKYKVYEVDFGVLGKVLLKDPLYGEGKIKYSTGESYLLVKFEHPENNLKSQCECNQDETYEDLQSDTNKIQNSNSIRGTIFYSNWMKIFFKKGQEYSLKKEGVEVKGVYAGQDTFKRNTHYFTIDGKKTKAEKLTYLGYAL